MFKIWLSRALACAAIVGGTMTMAGALDSKRPGIGQKEMADTISPEYDGRSDFARIFIYDKSAIHYYILEIQGNKPIKKVAEYSDAETCWKATFTEGPKDGPWRVCVPLDEPAEGFLAQYISAQM